MRHARRIITILATVAAWFVVAATTAYARVDPGGGVDGGGVDLSAPPPDSGTSVWRYLLVAAIAALLIVAVVGLSASLRHARHPRPTRPSPMSHA
ncbi:MAG: hypothetical protein ABI903_15490 [Actinomycetota bacterium]